MVLREYVKDVANDQLFVRGSHRKNPHDVQEGIQLKVVLQQYRIVSYARIFAQFDLRSHLRIGSSQ